MAIINLISSNQDVLISIIALLGLLVGSFLNVVVYRLPIMLQREWQEQCYKYLEIENPGADSDESTAKFAVFNLHKPDSHCPRCNHKIRRSEERRGGKEVRSRVVRDP